jgi:D-threo-aldose 1-dehydrogenase
MPYDPAEAVPVAKTGLHVTRLGLGGASIGGLFGAVEDAAAEALIEHAWERGVRYFDTAPLYGYGASERRFGRALAHMPRDMYVLSTKVGRLVRREDQIPPGADIDRQSIGGRDDAFFVRTEPLRVVFDFTADGVRRSIGESLERLGLDRIDIAFIHDPDEHWEAAIGQAYPALARLREEGVVGAIGAGMNQASMLARFAREADVDVFLVAGRYTLLDHTALDELLPRCVERGIAVVIGGVVNSGVLVDPRAGSHFDYRPAAPAILERARRLAEVCGRHDVPLHHAAIQFPLAHPAVVSVLAGVRTPGHLDEYPAAMRRRIPAALWEELRAERLIPAGAPVPSG